MAWIDNAALFFNDGGKWEKITDHNRAPISVSVERIETNSRMADGTLRRHVVAKKREWSISWDNLPSRRNATFGGKTGLTTVDGGWAGEDIENFHNTQNASFLMRIRGGDDDGKAITHSSIDEYRVMITSFSKEITKRGIVDLWNLSITLVEV